MQILDKERFSFTSHALGAGGAFIGMVVLLIMAVGDSVRSTITLVYGVSAVLMFTLSAAYHAKKREDDANTIWRKLDHLAIFIMIAGSYSIVSYFYLDWNLFFGITIAQWSLVFLGIFFTFFYISAPRFLSTLIYIVMGWLGAVFLKQLVSAMTPVRIAALVGGGVLYTIGAIIYAKKKPDILPDKIGFHGLFHLFILAAWAWHYYLVFVSMYDITRGGA